MLHNNPFATTYAAPPSKIAPSTIRVAPYTPPPIVRAAPPPAYAPIARNLAVYSRSTPPGFSLGRSFVQISRDISNEQLSPASYHHGATLQANFDAALQPNFRGYGHANVEVRAPIHISSSSARDEVRTQQGACEIRIHSHTHTHTLTPTHTHARSRAHRHSQTRTHTHMHTRAHAR